MENMYRQDFHIHTEASYDATMKMKHLVQRAKELGITEFGVTEHVNYEYMQHVHLKRSRALFELHRVPGMHFGVELSPLSIYQHEHTTKGKFSTYSGYVGGLHLDFSHPGTPGPDPLVLPMTEEQLRNYKVEYVVAAAHTPWHTPWNRYLYPEHMDAQELIAEWHRQQMFCATDSRVDVVGHSWWCPWWPGFTNLLDENGQLTDEPWFGDFKVIPQSMHDEFAAACKENDKCAEMNISFFCTGMLTDKFKHQYAEYIRDLFEKGVPISMGSDRHDDYPDYQELSAQYLRPVGFTADDFALPKFRGYE